MSKKANKKNKKEKKKEVGLLETKTFHAYFIFKAKKKWAYTFYDFIMWYLDYKGIVVFAGGVEEYHEVEDEAVKEQG